MQFKKLKDGYIIKVEKGEELIETLTKFCAENKIASGSISGVGGTNNVCLYYYDSELKEYLPKTFSGKNYEIISLSGNIALIDGKPFAHIHTALGDSDFSIFGGHLKSAIIGITGEVTINMIDGELHRSFDDVCKLNLLAL